ncbi:MAG: hypothetical protein EAZ69_09405 [Oscillatoriales cyanobacterium]|nr:MAG: hypothetical protein EAZ69_09405 [Oscillatoriales cyanobacterium]
MPDKKLIRLVEEARKPVISFPVVSSGDLTAENTEDTEREDRDEYRRMQSDLILRKKVEGLN